MKKHYYSHCPPLLGNCHVPPLMKILNETLGIRVRKQYTVQISDKVQPVWKSPRKYMYVREHYARGATLLRAVIRTIPIARARWC